MPVKLSQRLYAIANCITEVSSIADIGTDHGYLPVYLVESGRINQGIACDINKKPLAKAEKIIKKYGFEKIIETRLGSGLSVLKPNEVDALVLAGMGGILISELLEAKKEVSSSVKKLVLQPMNNQKFLRQYLETQGFEIVKEELVLEGTRVYEIIVARSGEMTIENPLDYELGYNFLKNKHPLGKVHVQRKIEKAKFILERTLGKGTVVAKQKFLESKDYIERLEEIKRWL